MPQGVDETKWDKAKKIAEKSDTAPEKGSDAWWAYVRGIYNRMQGGAHDKSASSQGRGTFDSGDVVARLLRLKAESDRGNFNGKHDRFRRLLKERPDEFAVDSREGSLHGVTHKPSGFRFHVPATEIPAQWRRSQDVLGKAAAAAPTDLSSSPLDTLRRLAALRRSVELK